MRSSRIVNIAGMSIIGLLLVAVAYGPISSIWASDLSFPAYRTVQDGGSSVTQRNILNFVFSTGAGSCVDSCFAGENGLHHYRNRFGRGDYRQSPSRQTPRSGEPGPQPSRPEPRAAIPH